MLIVKICQQGLLLSTVYFILLCKCSFTAMKYTNFWGQNHFYCLSEDTASPSERDNNDGTNRSEKQQQLRLTLSKVGNIQTRSFHGSTAAVKI